MHCFLDWYFTGCAQSKNFLGQYSPVSSKIPVNQENLFLNFTFVRKVVFLDKIYLLTWVPKAIEKQDKKSGYCFE